MRLFSHYVPRNTLFIAVLEALILAASVYLAAIVWADLGYTATADRLALESFMLAGSMLLVMSLLGVYGQSSIEGWKTTLIRLIVAAALGFGVVDFLSRELDGTLAVLGMPGVIGVAGALAVISLERAVVFRWKGAKVFRPQVLVLGTGSRAARVDEIVQAQPSARRMDVVGFVPANEESHYVPARRLVGREAGETLWTLVRRYGISEIIVGVRDRRNGGLPVEELLECRLHGVRVTYLTDFFERETGQIRVESLNTSWLIFSEGFRRGSLRNIVKRTFDILASGGLLLVTAPIMLLTAIAILATMGSPVFYKQQRVGEGRRVFTIRKFRSMKNDAEKDGKARWATSDDDRITRVGRVIRLLRIDELPQIFNVFRGDMSFVGPRPERPEFVRELAEEIPYYDVRHSIKPGITGWAQVRYAYGASVEDARQKLQYDLYYVKNHTLFLDIMILLDTVQVVLFGKGAR
ncbi:TIGR03013 family PEP-CTERM/XrtA system glycosyltransferase [Aquisalimonas lutea]|uniref:TIGR03013 family XrtA/PEP-CTERM system glycosyltransferase n=1 Tax=Aquisalimonas lutea TaxID=1327750 RepID=UPI0025B4E090|nr:TIGR03013 family XrtA/PEP-CTERM system glycosyltransferase [Aquisalimonas lutea]MDN3517165.1 TIGR03013 family PEP-CTERM/XrtA system glycosyltransferase [Aquisalimonas lutea]